LTHARKFIETDKVIEHLFASRSTSAVGYLVMTYRSSFSVYSVYDDGNSNSDQVDVWTLDYTHDKELR
jgi:hypothetical protein